MLLSAVQELNAKLTRNEAKLERFVKLTHAEQSEDGVSTGGLGERQGCLTYQEMQWAHRHTKHKNGLHLCARDFVRVCVLPRAMCAELCSLNCTRRALVLIVVVVVVAGKLRTGLVLIRTMQEDGLIDASEAQRLKAELMQERRDDASHVPKCALPPHRKRAHSKSPHVRVLAIAFLGSQFQLV